MTPPYELIMYSRTTPCPFVSLAKRVLEREAVPYRELMIDQHALYEERVVGWTGFLSVPTLIIASPGEELPFESPLPLMKGASPRGINRGSMLTEPNEVQLVAWLTQHGFLPVHTNTKAGK
jgi:glutaredoxin